MAKLNVKKGDLVEVIAGKDRGVRAEIIKALPKVGKVVVEGVAVAKKHQKPTQYGEQGGIVDKPMPIDVSNVQLVCPKCEKATRIGHAFGEDGKKYRVCKKCGHQF
jgi:large subunit ribosomal protein L24